MQPYSLTIDKFLDHASKWFDQQEVVAVNSTTQTSSVNYSTLRERSNQLSGALFNLDLHPGDRIATLAWNTQHHLEIYYATMGAGLICHTLNPRFSVSHLASIINEAENRAMAVAVDLLPLVEELLVLCPSIEHVIIMDEALAELPLKPDNVQWWQQDALVSTLGKAVAWGDFDENTPAGLCYTSGTTGKPKGVLYTHRSNYLHTLRALQSDAMALTAADVLMVAVPMFHANAWGLPFSAPAVGAKIVLPGRDTSGANLAQLMRAQKVTTAVGVQTVWLGLIEYLDKSGENLPDLQRIVIGGSKCPESLIKRMEQRLGAQVQTSWGMTELSPLGTVTPLRMASSGHSNAGRPPMGLDIKLTNADGETLIEQRGEVGHLKVKGPSVVDKYYLSDKSELDEEGYFDTGDLALVDQHGNLSICGRSKDLIKSGGEWINPAEIEEIIGQHPQVAQVAVFGRFDAKWGERPVLVVEVEVGIILSDEVLINFLKGKVPDWWLPNEVVQIDKMPLAATGKIDKRQLNSL